MKQKMISLTRATIQVIGITSPQKLKNVGFINARGKKCVSQFLRFLSKSIVNLFLMSNRFSFHFYALKKSFGEILKQFPSVSWLSLIFELLTDSLYILLIKERALA